MASQKITEDKDCKVEIINIATKDTRSETREKEQKWREKREKDDLFLRLLCILSLCWGTMKKLKYELGVETTVSLDPSSPETPKRPETPLEQLCMDTHTQKHTLFSFSGSLTIWLTYQSSLSPL